MRKWNLHKCDKHPNTRTLIGQKECCITCMRKLSQPRQVVLNGIVKIYRIAKIYGHDYRAFFRQHNHLQGYFPKKRKVKHKQKGRDK